MKNNKFIVILVILIIGLALLPPKTVIKNDKKEFSTAQEEGFEDEAFYQCVTETMQMYTIDYDGIEYLYCSSKGITSVKGIEKLTNLETLYLDDNKISSMDLSHNTNLKDLIIEKNNVRSLDLSANTNLEALSAQGNGMYSLKLPQSASNIKSLGLGGNDLKQFDPKKYTGLIALDLSDNGIESIDLSNNTALLVLKLANNYITNIDVSKLTKLAYLNVATNNLSKIDLSHNDKLMHLNVSDNNLKSIDLSSLTSLIGLNVTRNNITNNYIIPNKSNIIYLVADYNWLKTVNLSEYTNLKKLSIIYHETINVVNEKVDVSELEKRIPEGVKLNSTKVYPTLENSLMCDGPPSSIFDNDGNNNNPVVPPIGDGDIKVKFTSSLSDLQTAAQFFGTANDPEISMPNNIVDMYEMLVYYESTIDCDNVVTEESINSDEYGYLQIHSTDVTIDGIQIPDNVDVDFSSYYDINYLNDDNTDDDGEQTIKNVPDTGATIMNIVLFGMIILALGVYIVTRATQTNEIRND